MLPRFSRAKFAKRWGDGAPAKVIANEFGLEITQVDYLRRTLQLPARRKPQDPLLAELRKQASAA